MRIVKSTRAVRAYAYKLARQAGLDGKLAEAVSRRVVAERNRDDINLATEASIELSTRAVMKLIMTERDEMGIYHGENK